MTDLIDLDLTDNPLTSPPAQICSKGKVFIFKYLENAASRDKVEGANSLRRSSGKKSSHFIYESMKTKTNSPDSVDYTFEPFTKLDIVPNSFHVRTELSKSDTSTPTGVFPSALNDSLLDNELLKRKLENRVGIKSDPTSMNNISVLNNDNISAKLLENQKTPEKLKSIETIQTYREYKEALKQQRNNDVYSVYKSKDSLSSLTRSDSENFNSDNIIDCQNNSTPKIIKENSTKQNGTNKESYTKPNSPMKLSKIAVQNRLASNGNNTKNSNAVRKTTNNRAWDAEGNEKLSFTMRREFDRHKEEAELMKQLKSVIF
jgi:hypothetical protein